MWILTFLLLDFKGKKILYDILAFAKESVHSHVTTLGPQNFPANDKEPWLVDFFAPVSYFHLSKFIIVNFLLSQQKDVFQMTWNHEYQNCVLQFWPHTASKRALMHLPPLRIKYILVHVYDLQLSVVCLTQHTVYYNNVYFFVVSFG